MLAFNRRNDIDTSFCPQNIMFFRILIGGFSHFSDGQAVVRKMQIFNPTENAWREGPEYPGIGKGSYATAVLGDQIYVCSGLYYQSFSTLYDHTASSGNQNPRDCYRYSGDERTW